MSIHLDQDVAAPPPAAAFAAPPAGGLSAPHRALIVFGAALGLCAGFAPLYFGTISVFLQPIAHEFGWGRAQTSAAGVLSMLGLAAGSIVVGQLIDRFGETRVIGGSASVMAVFMAIQSLCGNSPWLFAALSFGIGVAGAGTTPPGYLTVLARCLRDRLGVALGLAGIGMGVGTISMPVIAQTLIAHYGWRSAYAGLAAGALLLGWLACAIISRGARGLRGHARQRRLPAGSMPVPGYTVREALADRRLWLILAVTLLVSMATLGMSVHFVSLLVDGGITPQLAARAVAVSGAGVVLGRVVSGYLIDRFAARKVAAAAFCLAAAGAVLMASELSRAIQFSAFAGLLLGFALGAEGDFLPFFVKKYFGLKSFGRIYGVLFFVHGLGGIAGPVLFGLSFDHFATYKYALLCASGALCAAMLLVLRLGSYRFSS
ncbi:MFS transporter [Cupriavidus basilensis]|uniref:MFS transporter n=1 Tax=Cupriavidus basilensis TaxID=68895 RepID=UPI0009E60890|nr:MFS transporter [Cupriavidus basilensis]